MQYHTAFYLTKPKVYCPHIVGLSCMNGVVSSLLTLNGKGVTARTFDVNIGTTQGGLSSPMLFNLTFSTNS